MDDLERRYRRLLRVLPASYRRGHEEEMVSTFLEVTAADHPTAPADVATPGDVATPADAVSPFANTGSTPAGDPDPVRQETPGVLALALRLRLGLSRNTERDRVRSQALRLVLLLGLFAMMVTYVFNALFLAWTQHVLPWLPAPTFQQVGPSGLHSVMTHLPVLACAALLALVLGRHRAGRFLALLYLVPALLLEIYSVGESTLTAVQLSGPVIAVIFDGLLVFTALTLDVQAPPVPRTSWLAAMVSGIVLTGVVFAATAVGQDTFLANVTTNTAIGSAWVVVALLHWRRGLGGYRLPRTLGLAVTGTFLVLFQFGWLAAIYASTFPHNTEIQSFRLDLGVGLAMAVVCAIWLGPIRRELSNLSDDPRQREHLSPAC